MKDGKLTITIETGNAAFDNPRDLMAREHEIAMILDRLVMRLRNGQVHDHKLHDVSGNVVGEFTYVEKKI